MHTWTSSQSGNYMVEMINNMIIDKINMSPSIIRDLAVEELEKYNIGVMGEYTEKDIATKIIEDYELNKSYYEYNQSEMLEIKKAYNYLK